jgi:hypothetical protein
MGSPNKGIAKKPYSTPKLTNYGTVRQLTENVGMHGHRDNQRMPPNRTHI